MLDLIVAMAQTDGTEEDASIWTFIIIIIIFFFWPSSTKPVGTKKLSLFVDDYYYKRQFI